MKNAKVKHIATTSIPMPLDCIRKPSLKTRIALAVLLVFVAALWSFFFYTRHTLRQDMQRVLGEQQFSAVSLQADQLGGEIAERFAALRALGERLGATADRAEWPALLRQQAALPTLFNSGVVLVDAHSTLLAAAPAVAAIPPPLPASASVARSLREGRATVGWILPDPDSSPAADADPTALTLCLPLPGARETAPAVLCGITRLAQANFLDPVTRSRYGKNGRYLLIDREQQLLIAASDGDGMTTTAIDKITPAGQQLLAAGESTSLHADAADGTRLSSIRHIAGTSWSVIAEMPAGEAFAAIDTMQRRLWQVSALLTLATVVLIVWIVRRQFAALRATAEHLSHLLDSGRLDALPSLGQDEIGSLSGVFNRLLQTLGWHKDALRESEMRFKALHDASFSGIGIHDQGSIIECNQGLGDITGYAREELIGMDGLQLIAAPWRALVMQHIRSGYEAPYEVEGLRKDGTTYPLAIQGKNIPYGDRVLRATEFRDISERCRLQRALLDSHEMLRSILETTPDGFWRIDLNARIVHSNPAYSRLSGYTLEELAGMRIAELEAQLDEEAIACRIRQIVEQGSARFETQHRRKDGAVWHVETSCTYHATPEGEIFVFLRDISERKRNEELLEKRLDALTQPVCSDRIDFADLFRLDEIQRIQDEFAQATGVASIITTPDGEPITAPSNFTRLCSEIIRGTEKGCTNCQQSDALIGRHHPAGPLVQRCMSSGLWDAGTAINVGGHHLANWLIGQVRDENVDAASLRAYATEIGADEGEFMRAFDEVPAMSREHFEQIAQALFTLANQLSLSAYNNLRQARFITEQKAIEAQLQNSQKLFSLFMEHSPIYVFIKEVTPHESRVIQASDNFREMVGIEAQDMIGKSMHEIFPPEFAARITADDWAVITGNSVFRQDEDFNGRHYTTIKFPIDMGEKHILAGYTIDITERRRAEEETRLAASVFSHAREGIMITDGDGAIIDVNESFSRITGYTHDEVLGKNPRLLKSGIQDAAFYTLMWTALEEKGHWYGELWNRRKNGELFAELLTISTISDASGRAQHYVALFSDITALKEHQKRLEHIAHFDVLTTLPNRVLLADRLQQAMAQADRRGQLLAVAYLDLDGFKSINDRYGHETGDHLLISLSEQMKQSLREGDTLARLGGDEFIAVLLDLNDTSDSIPMLTRLLDAAATPVRVNGLSLQVSASLGITFYPQAEDVDADQLFRQADQAMYQAKLAGKNRYHIFDAEQDRSVRGHHESLEHIRRALNRHEFVLHYQPKVNMRTGVMIGAEALIRWQHPERGLLHPAAFLPVIEDHALAVEVGEWVIDAALRQMELWRRAGTTIPISVNVGARQLLHGNFAERLREILATHPGTRPGDLEIEILETSALEDLTRVSEIIEECRTLGVAFSLDDFGTGYSSLTYLKHLSVSQLKIDQSFVRDMLDDPDDLSILGGVLSLATAFRRQVLAEGVETVAHGAMLLQLGCELAQGYGIARPMPATDLPRWATSWRPDPDWSQRPPINRDDFPLLFAGVEHRAWIAAVEEFLRGERETLPLVHHQCRFSAWLDSEGLALHRDHPAFAPTIAVHRAVHALAERLCADKADGRGNEALSELPALYRLRDTLLEQLQMLVVPGPS